MFSLTFCIYPHLGHAHIASTLVPTVATDFDASTDLELESRGFGMPNTPTVRVVPNPKLLVGTEIPSGICTCVGRE